MHYIEFVKENPQTGGDPILERISTRFIQDKNFPVTSDIKQIADYLWDKLDDEETTKLKSSIIFWSMMQGKSPTLDEIKYISDIQIARR